MNPILQELFGKNLTCTLLYWIESETGEEEERFLQDTCKSEGTIPSWFYPYLLVIVRLTPSALVLS